MGMRMHVCIRKQYLFFRLFKAALYKESSHYQTYSISTESCVSILTNSSCILTSFNNPDFPLFFLAFSQLSFHGQPLIVAAGMLKEIGCRPDAAIANSINCSHGKKF
jgi:hypothetical protein